MSSLRLTLILILMVIIGCNRDVEQGESGTFSNGQIALPISARLQKLSAVSNSSLTAELIIDGQVDHPIALVVDAVNKQVKTDPPIQLDPGPHTFEIDYFILINGVKTKVASGTARAEVAASSNSTSVQIVSLSYVSGVTLTIAGKPGGPGFHDGIGTSARFSEPSGVVSDGTNLYVTDSGNNTIRKIVIATREVSTFAGSPGVTGSADGIGSAAQFNSPTGITIDKAGSYLYVSDSGNNTIRKIVVATREVSTLAGSPGAGGSTDGIGAAARFGLPGGMAVDNTGRNLYVVDSLFETIKKIVIETREVSTLAGSADTAGSTDGVGSAALFYGPTGIVIDSTGNHLYLTDSGNNTIRKIVIATREVSTFAGSARSTGSTDGVGSAALFYGPIGIAIDSTDSNLYVADLYSETIRKIVIATQEVSTFAGSAGSTGSTDGVGSAARFGFNLGSLFSNTPYVAIDNSGSLYVADFGNSSVRRIVIATQEVSTLAGSTNVFGSADGKGSAALFGSAAGIVIDGTGSNLYLADNERGEGLNSGDTIRRIVVEAGEVSTLAGMAGFEGFDDGIGSSARFFLPIGIAVDNTAGNLYVTDSSNGTIRKIVIATQEVSTFAGNVNVFRGSADGIGSAAQFNAPHGIAIDNTGSNLYVADFGNGTIRKIVIATQEVSTIAGSAVAGGSTDGIGAAARFGSPNGIAIDSTGSNLYVVDSGNNTIRKIVIATQEVSTIAGIPGPGGFTDDAGAAAKFSTPVGITIDSSNTNLYVTDSGNHAIRKIDLATNNVTTLAGACSSSTTFDGVGAQACFASPYGIVSDKAFLYVTDSVENVIRQLTQ